MPVGATKTFPILPHARYPPSPETKSKPSNPTKPNYQRRKQSYSWVDRIGLNGEILLLSFSETVSSFSSSLARLSYNLALVHVSEEEQVDRFVSAFKWSLLQPTGVSKSIGVCKKNLLNKI